MILGIEGSPRKGGNSQLLLRTILDAARAEGAESFEAHLRDYRMEPCVGCEACRTHKECTRFQDGMTLLYPRIVDARGLVLVSPVHNYNVTAWVKAFIDRMYCFYDFEDTRPRAWSSRLAGQGRRAVVACMAEQVHKADMGIALEAMRLPLAALGYEIVAEVAVLGHFDRAAVGRDADALDRAREAGRLLARSL